MGNSKRNISKLEKNFREKIADYAIDHNLKCKNAILVLKATGCRPSELKKGISARMKNENEIEFFILGSKLNLEQKRGIRMRKICISINNENEKYLLSLKKEILNSENDRIKIEITSEKSFSGYITKISKKIWVRKIYHASAYSFRHALATDLKNNNTNKIKIAQVMGHASTRAQQSYGRRSRSKSKGGLDDIADVETSATPRGGDRLLRFKIASSKRVTERLKGVDSTPIKLPSVKKFKR